MSEWKEYRLGDVGKIVTGKTPKTAITDNYGGNIPFLSPSDNMELKYVPITARHLTEKGLAEVKSCLIPENSVCVSCIGSDMGKSVITVRPIVTNQQINSIIPSSNFDTNFLYYILQNKKREIKFLGRNGTAVPILNKSAFSNLTILAPELDEQRSIASILSSLDSKIENNRKICANLEAQAQALFKHWFIDFAPFKDGKFVESELGMIPEGWRVGTFTEIFNLCPGGTPKTSESSYWENGNIPFFSPKDVTGIYCFKTEKQITKEGLNNCSSRLYDTNTVLITCRGTVGKVTMSAVPMAMNQSNYAILAKEGYSQYYAYLMTVAIVRKLKFKAVGSVFDAITSKDFNEKIIIPDFATLKSFDSLISTFFEEIKAKGFESSRLSTLRDTLLPKLMSGEIKV